MNMQTTRRIAAVSMAGAATLAIAGFTALGSIFEYPQILKAPTDEILAAYRENQSAISGWFLVLRSALPCSPRSGCCWAVSPAARWAGGSPGWGSPGRPSR